MKCTRSWDILGRYWPRYVCVLLDILDRYWPRYVCVLLDILDRYWLCYVCVLLDILDRYWPRYVCILLDDVYGEDDEAEELYDEDDQHISAAALLGHTGIVGSL